jgi:hypothetical protein
MIGVVNPGHDLRLAGHHDRVQSARERAFADDRDLLALPNVDVVAAESAIYLFSSGHYGITSL